MHLCENLVFEGSEKGRTGFDLPKLDVPEADLAALGQGGVRQQIDGFPEMSEIDVVRHFTRLSRWNYAIDVGLFPLGSCTMKYNPRINEKIASMSVFRDTHPYAPEDLAQANLAVMHALSECLREIIGLPGITLQPAAGAQGEFTGMKILKAYHRERGDTDRNIVLIPDSAHGTNPSSASICGFKSKEMISDARGCIDLASLKENLNDSIAGLMLTNPNTLGIFEEHIKEICDLAHSHGALVYCDGANMNAMLGVTRPGDHGIDIIHLNLHKTFSTPHGGGGPGSGPVLVAKHLEPFLPLPRVIKDGDGFRLGSDFPKSIGRVRGFHGNFGMMVRALAYILRLGPDGLRRAGEAAVLNANYLKTRLRKTYHLKFDKPTLHEAVFDDHHLKETGVTALDVAKRLMDYGFHPPTIYFPLVVHGALMIEPTESADIVELDRFADAMLKISEESQQNPELLKTAPHSTPVSRLDEVHAARHPKFRWKP